MENKKQEETQTEAPEASSTYKMGDDLIAVIRELVQLALLTGTNIVDHLRAIKIEVDPNGSNKLIPTEEYIYAYNEMITELTKKAEEQQKLSEIANAGSEVPPNQSN